MKKLISLLLAFAMIFSMAGCTSGSPQENNDTMAAASAAAIVQCL